MPNPLTRKLETVGRLTDEDRERLQAMISETRDLPARRDVIREGARPECIHLMVEGWAARYKVLPDGSRQITAFLIPGDFCDLHVSILGEMDHAIATLTPATIAYVPHETVDALAARPAIARAFWWATLVDEAVLREWIVNLGRRDALERIAHILCEMHLRMRSVGLVTDEDRFNLPLTQEELADSVGLTPVHVNRVLQRLRKDGLIEWHGGQLTLLDVQRLQRAGGFNSVYLHLVDRARQPPARRSVVAAPQ